VNKWNDFLGRSRRLICRPANNFNGKRLMMTTQLLADPMLDQNRWDHKAYRLPPVPFEPTYKHCFDVSPVGFAVTRPDGRIVRVNHRLCQLLGQHREDLETKLLHQSLFAIESEAKELPLKAIAEGQIKDFTTQFSYGQHGQVHKLWLRCSISRAEGAGEDNDFLFCAFEDVSSRRAEQQAFEHQRGRYEQLLALSASLPGALSIYRLLPDGTSHIDFVTPSFGHILGYSPGELGPDGRVSFFKNVHPDDVSRLIDSIKHAAKDQEPWRAEYRVIHPERGLVHIAESAAPELEPDGTIIWYCFVQDVTNRNRDHAKLRQAAAVFQNSQEAIAIIDTAGLVVATNPSFQALAGDYTVRPGQSSLQRLLRADLQTYRRAIKSIADTGAWQGEGTFKTKDGHHTPQWVVVSPVYDEAGLPINFVVSLVDISRIKQTETKLNHLATHDTLTGLPNRMLLNQSLNTAVQSSKQTHRQGAVLFIDLDRFKTVNDSLGHPAGDELLRTVAQRIKLRLRGSDTVARLGGDEFVILLEDIESNDDACKVARDVIELIEEPVTVSAGQDVYVSASVGISYFPQDSTKADELIQCADAALYAAKENGRGTFRLYDVSLTRSANQKLETESRMRRALARNEFQLHYQPIIDIQRGTAVGAEALIRWNDPQHGFVQPMSFIPLAEDTGFIVPLGDWIIRSACTQLQCWEAAGLEMDILSINLSARQFRLVDLPQRIEAILKETRASPHKIEFEITESALMEGGEDALEKLNALKRLGVRLSIDDFGTGYSSLSMLKRFPIDTLKIDRSFVRDVTSDHTARQIALAIVSLAKTLNLEIVAEGIEDKSQQDFIRSIGCKLAQGFLFSRPLAVSDFYDWYRAARCSESPLG
jgi:diguanylate cyclase (GGDEF)-like protein/PAS domain S-box-containing protein